MRDHIGMATRCRSSRGGAAAVLAGGSAWVPGAQPPPETAPMPPPCRKTAPRRPRLVLGGAIPRPKRAAMGLSARRLLSTSAVAIADA